MEKDIECRDCAHATKTGYSLTCDLPNEIECDPVRRTIPQDAKTAAIVRAATLRAVGEELATRPKYQGFGRLAVAVSLEEIEALLAGKTPAGWEKE